MKKGDEPIYPIEGAANAYSFSGITLREHFAGLAMQGILVNAGRNGLDFHNAYKEAVKQADLLLSELENHNETII